MNMDLRRLRHLLAVAHSRSFSRAAAELHLTQPALSHSIAQIEQEYGLRFFDRDRSGVRLTQTGQAFMGDAEALIGQAEALEAKLRSWGKGEAGIVRFGLGPLAASLILPRLLSQLTKAAPRIQPHVTIKAAHALLDDLELGEIEFLVCGEHLITSAHAVNRENLKTVELALLVRSGHPLARRRVVTVEDINQFSVIAGGSERKINAGIRTDPTEILVSVVCEDYQILKAVMLNSDAIFLASPEFVAPEIENHEVVALNVEDMQSRWPPMNMQVVTMSGRSRGPALERVLANLRKLFCFGEGNEFTGN